MAIGITANPIQLSDTSVYNILAQQEADSQAQIAYQRAQAAGLSAAAATNAAAEKWKEVYDAATLTGMYNGQPTMAAAGLYGYSGGASGTGTPTMAEVGQQNQNALDLLKIGAGLRGPQNYLQYSKVLNGTPQGLRDILSAAAGNLRIPGFGGGLTGAAATSPGGVATPSAIGPNGQLNVTAAASSPLPASSPLAPHTAAPLEAASLAGMASDIANPSQTAPYAGYGKDLVNPNQIDPRAWANFSPTQKSLDLGAYEAQGWDPNDVQALFNKSLPQYGGATRGQVANMFGG